MIALLIVLSVSLSVFALSFQSGILALLAGLAIVLTVSVAVEDELRRERSERRSRNR